MADVRVLPTAGGRVERSGSAGAVHSVTCWSPEAQLVVMGNRVRVLDSTLVFVRWPPTPETAATNRTAVPETAETLRQRQL